MTEINTLENHKALEQALAATLKIAALSPLSLSTSDHQSLVEILSRVERKTKRLQAVQSTVNAAQ